MTKLPHLRLQPTDDNGVEGEDGIGIGSDQDCLFSEEEEDAVFPDDTPSRPVRKSLLEKLEPWVRTQSADEFAREIGIRYRSQRVF